MSKRYDKSSKRYDKARADRGQTQRGGDWPCGCDKKRYDTKHDAREALAAMFAKDGRGHQRNFQTYKCPGTRGIWHIGHSKFHDPTTGKTTT